jgi:hypothetical protein
VVSAAPLLPRSSLSTWTISSWPSRKRFLDRRAAGFDAGLEEGAGDFLEGQKAVPLRAVVDERRFQAGLDAGNDRFIDVAFFLFLGGRFNVQVNQFLTVDNGDTEFLGLCRVEQHAFHILGSRALSRGQGLVQAVTD